MEGFKRNKFYLPKIVDLYSPMLFFIQEHWLADHECDKMSHLFQNYNFRFTSDNMLTPIEDRLLRSGAIWHGTAIAWKKSFDIFVKILPVVSKHFCGISILNNKLNSAEYSDDVFLFNNNLIINNYTQYKDDIIKYFN